MFLLVLCFSWWRARSARLRGGASGLLCRSALSIDQKFFWTTICLPRFWSETILGQRFVYQVVRPKRVLDNDLLTKFSVRNVFWATIRLLGGCFPLQAWWLSSLAGLLYVFPCWLGGWLVFVAVLLFVVLLFAVLRFDVAF